MAIEDRAFPVPSVLIVKMCYSYIAEPTYYYRITIFTTAGVFLASFGKQGSGPGHVQFCYPYGITVDKEFIYISDYGNGQIHT